MHQLSRLIGAPERSLGENIQDATARFQTYRSVLMRESNRNQRASVEVRFELLHHPQSTSDSAAIVRDVGFVRLEGRLTSVFERIWQTHHEAAPILHRMWIDGTEFSWSSEDTAMKPA